MWNCLGHTYACNNLTSFWNSAHAITGSGKYANLLKLILEKFVKSQQVNLFLAGFSHLKPLCMGLKRKSRWACPSTFFDCSFWRTTHWQRLANDWNSFYVGVKFVRSRHFSVVVSQWSANLAIVVFYRVDHSTFFSFMIICFSRKNKNK